MTTRKGVQSEGEKLADARNTSATGRPKNYAAPKRPLSRRMGKTRGPDRQHLVFVRRCGGLAGLVASGPTHHRGASSGWLSQRPPFDQAEAERGLGGHGPPARELWDPAFAKLSRHRKFANPAVAARSQSSGPDGGLPPERLGRIR